MAEWVSAPETHSRVSNINFDMQWSTMLWDIPYSTNNNVIHGISYWWVIHEDLHKGFQYN